MLDLALPSGSLLPSATKPQPHTRGAVPQPTTFGFSDQFKRQQKFGFGNSLISNSGSVLIALMLPIVVRNIKSGVIDNKQVVTVQVILVRATLGVQTHVEEGNEKYEMDTKFVIVIVNNSVKTENKLYYPS
ncbi:hypothetical protein ZIOFF_005665 [Zingiber officinale]|uniref:Uncharacterized protein n=1 Tax=Zingiber officinale TaxID=94328 RepID=A0A8J5M4G7_ZINOF|nr:hypothetical protein ZIOFF_005665 [Zingiber officinale]